MSTAAERAGLPAFFRDRFQALDRQARFGHLRGSGARCSLLKTCPQRWHLHSRIEAEIVRIDIQNT
jgi:hypothetical protein